MKNGVAVLNIALLPVLDCNPSFDFRMSFTLLSKVLGKPIPAPFTPIPCRAFPWLSVVGISLGFTQLIPPRVSTCGPVVAPFIGRGALGFAWAFPFPTT